MKYEPVGSTFDHTLIWPKSPETPRYSYVGELIGESNFYPIDGDKKGAVEKFFGWLVGLGQRNDAPMELLRPQSVATDNNGRVFATDVARGAIMVFDEPNGALALWTQATPTQNFESPIGIAVGQDGTIYVADAELKLVARLAANGTPLKPFGEGLLTRPTGVAVDLVRNLVFVGDTHGHNIKVFDGQGVLYDTIGRRGTGNGEFNSPTHVAYADNKLYVTDTVNARVQIFDSDGGFLSEFGTRGMNLGDFVRPKGIGVDNDGNIYVIESYYDHLLIYNEQGQFMLPIGGSGKTPGKFFLPAGLWVDERDRVYVADMFNGRIMIFQYLGGDS